MSAVLDALELVDVDVELDVRVDELEEVSVDVDVELLVELDELVSELVEVDEDVLDPVLLDVDPSLVVPCMVLLPSLEVAALVDELVPELVEDEDVLVLVLLEVDPPLLEVASLVVVFPAELESCWVLELEPAGGPVDACEDGSAGGTVVSSVCPSQLAGHPSLPTKPTDSWPGEPAMQTPG